MTMTYSNMPDTEPDTAQAKTSDDIEADIRSTRRNIDDNLERIQRKFSPGDIVDNVIDFARTNGGAVAGSVGRTVRENPVPLAMIGAGVLWLALSSRNRRENAEERQGDSLPKRASAAAGKMRHKAGEVGEEVRHKADEVGEEVRHKAGELSREARDQAVRAKESSGRFVKEHPLLVGAAGLALGAAVATALPRSKREDRTFGERSDKVKHAAKEAAMEEGRKVQSAAKSAIRKAKQEAEKQSRKSGPSGTKAASGGDGSTAAH